MDCCKARLDLAIRGTATYACFSVFLTYLGVTAPLPGPLQPCQTGRGQFLPIELDVVDTGSLEIKKQIVMSDKGPKTVGSDIIIKGTLTVSVETHTDLNLLVRGDYRAFSVQGEMQITDAIGEVALH